jgi:predicted Holliday junction resolvase-like endonuclease
MISFFLGFLFIAVVILWIVTGDSSRKENEKLKNELAFHINTNNQISIQNQQYYEHIALLQNHISQERERVKEQMSDIIKEERADAIKSSKEIVRGKTVEQIAPLLPNFPYDPADTRFLGSPLDIIIFDGLTAGCVNRLIFADIKTGQAQLTEKQKQIKRCVDAAAVEFQTIRIGA